MDFKVELDIEFVLFITVTWIMSMSQHTKMSSEDEKQNGGKALISQAAFQKSTPSIRQGETTEEDPAIRGFYSEAVSEGYRLKSELVSQHLADIGMGK